MHIRSVKRRPKSLLVLAGAAVALSVLSGCGESSTKGSGAGSLTIGGNFSLTGPGSPFGIPNEKSVEVTLKEIKKSGYLGDLDLDVDVVDNGTDLTRAVTNFNKAVANGSPIVFESALTPILQAVQPVANQKKAVYVSLFSGGTGEDSEDYVFRMGDFISSTGRFADYAVNNRKLKKIVAIIDTQNSAFVGTGKLIESKLVEAGGNKYVKQIAVASADTDFSTAAAQVRDLDPDGVVVLALPSQAGNIIKQLHEAGVDAQFLGQAGYSPEVAKVAGDAAEGTLAPQLWVPTQEGSEDFVAAYRAKWNEDPAPPAAMAHDALWMVAIAYKALMDEGKEVTGPNLKAELPAATESPDFEKHALVKDFRMAASGAPTYEGVVAQFKGGVLVPVK